MCITYIHIYTYYPRALARGRRGLALLDGEAGAVEGGGLRVDNNNNDNNNNSDLPTNSIPTKTR